MTPRFAIHLSASLVLVSATLAVLHGCGATDSLSATDPAAAYQSLFDDSSARASSDGHSGGPLVMLTNLLTLTDEQQAQAQDIFDRLRADMEALREQGRTDFESLLTPDQLAKLEELRAEHEAQTGADGSGPPPFAGPRHAGPGFGFHPLFMHGMGDREAMHQAMLDRLKEELGLSDDQVAQISALKESQHTAATARRQQAKDEFRAILTADQIAIIDEIQAHRP